MATAERSGTVAPQPEAPARARSRDGGNVEVGLLNYGEGESQFQAGELRPVCSLSPKPIASLDGAPTAREVGIDMTASTVRGFACLSGVPEDRVKILEQVVLRRDAAPAYEAPVDWASVLDDGSEGTDEG